jgi:flagellar biosynthesis protein FlhB
VRPISRDAVALLAVGAAWWSVSALAPSFLQSWRQGLSATLTATGAATWSDARMIGALDNTRGWLLAALPVLGAILLATLVAWLAQGALRFRSRTAASRVQTTSTAGLATLWSCVKGLVMAAAFASVAQPALRAMVATPTSDLAYSQRLLSAAIDTIASRIGLVLGLLVIADLIVQRLLWRRGLRMTRDELKRELRETDGDPTMRAERRGRQRQTALEP